MKRPIVITELNEVVEIYNPKVKHGVTELLVVDHDGKYTAEIVWRNLNEPLASELFSLHTNVKDLEDEINQSESVDFEVRIVPFETVVDNFKRAWDDMLTYWLEQTDEGPLDNSQYPFDESLLELEPYVHKWLKEADRYK